VSDSLNQSRAWRGRRIYTHQDRRDSAPDLARRSSRDHARADLPLHPRTGADVTAGVGRAQAWGGSVEEIRPGDVVRIPPGRKQDGVLHGALDMSRYLASPE
jgi:hypothetical protein